MNKSITHINFLFGSGISIKAGMPTTEEITNRVLNPFINGKLDNSLINLEDKNGYISKNELYVRRILLFLSWLKSYEEIYFFKDYEGNRKVNYEDLYFVIDQIYQSNRGYLENPALKPLIDLVKKDNIFLLSDKLEQQLIDLDEFLPDVLIFITEIICSLLKRKIGDLSYLDFLKEVNNDIGIDKADVFTLNHDLLLEEYFSQNDIKYIDGFREHEKRSGRIRDWNPEVYNLSKDDIASKFRLFKLHGSVDWHDYEDPEWIPVLVKTLEGWNWQVEYSYYPKLLIGTLNKIINYSTRVYLDLFNQFYNSLHSSKYLIISGYSFGDKGINSQIINWLIKFPDYGSKRIIIIDKNLDNVNKFIRDGIGPK